jgi:glycine/D-amino acid oxidase-like deaminating enzyme
VVPWQNQTVLVGATVEDVGFDERTTAAGVRDLLDAVCELLPRGVSATFPRSARRPASGQPDACVLGLPALHRLIYATGHYRNGCAPRAADGTVDCDLIVDGRKTRP